MRTVIGKLVENPVTSPDLVVFVSQVFLFLASFLVTNE